MRNVMLLLLLLLCAGCGVSGFGVVAGTTGYLKEYNKGQRSVEITKAEREEMNAWLNANYGGDK